MSGNPQESPVPKARDKWSERLRAAIGEQLGLAMGRAGKGGRKPGIPKIITRKDRPVEGEPQCCLKVGKTVASLGVPASRKGETTAALAMALMSRRLEDDGEVRASDVTVGQIIDWHLDQKTPKKSSSKLEAIRHSRLKSRLGNFGRILGDRRLRNIDPKSVTDYVDKRMVEPHKQYKDQEKAPRVSEATARGELGDLNRAIKAFDRQFNLDWTPEIDAGRPFRARDYLLSRNGMARLLMACRGYVWDPDADGYHVILVGGHRVRDAKFKRVFLKGQGGWMTETVEDPETGKTVVRYVRRPVKAVRHRDAVARLALIGAYSGTRHEAMLGLSWVRHRARGYIDVVNDVIHRAGDGEDPEKGKPRASSVMRPKLSFFADLWSEADRVRKIKSVIHHPGGDPYKRRIEDTWWETAADAGMPWLEVHHLRHAAITWMLHDGKTVHETAEAMGVSMRTVDRHYRQPSLAAQKVNRRWGYHQVAKGWDTVDVVDPADEAYHALMNKPRAVGSKRVRRDHRRPLTGRSVRQPPRCRKPKKTHEEPRIS